MKTSLINDQVARRANLVSTIRNFVVILFLFFSGILSAQTTLYSYQSGNWNTSSTWTTDPSGTLFVNPANLTPGMGIPVAILNGRTVTIPVGLNSQICNSLDVQEGGILLLGLTTDHNFGNVTGKGTIKMEAQTTTFGVGTNFTTFVAKGGGSFELNNSSDFNLPPILNPCNNLVVNNSASGIEVTLLNNLTINGNFEIRSGTFKINNDVSNTALTITLLGNLEVGTDGNITTGQGNASGGHCFNIKGDFTNNGNVRFSNLVTYSYQADPSNGYVHAIFNNDKADQNIQCNNITSFYRIEIAKGVDKTYVLNIDAASSSNFLLLGHNFKTPDWSDVTGNDNALGLESGTCRLGSNIVIPCLATGFYYIKKPACLWLDGAQIVFKDASYPTQPIPGTNDCGLYVYGALKMTGNSRFIINSFAFRGIVLRGSASVEFRDNAVFSASLFRTSSSSYENRGAFILHDNASVTLTGNTYDLHYATFDIGYPDNMVEISGGTLNIQAPTDAGTGELSLYSFHVACESRNINVTGGTININIPSAVRINSTMPFWDLNFTSASASYGVTVHNIAAWVTPALAPQPLIVKHNLSLNNYARLILNNTDGTPATVNLTVGGNFTIQDNAVYTPGANTTTFNGAGGQNFANNGTITSGLNNMVLSGTANVSIARDITVLGTLTLNSGCRLNDVGHYITVSGDVYNSGIQTSQAGGGIVLGGSTLQNLDGSGNGVFGNLIQNNNSGAALKANQTLNGDLRLVANAILNIRSYNLIMSASSKVYSSLNTPTASFSSSRMICTSGLESDGGITKHFSTSDRSFIYPFGVSDKYTPAKISVNANPTTYGSVTIRPVNNKVPFATSSDILSYYWKTRSEGFTGIAANSIRHTYTYVDSDVLPLGYDNNYVAGVYISPTGWTSWAPDFSTVDENNDTIKLPTPVASGIAFIDGDFTAGAANAFSNVVTYYSARSGDWNNPSTWSTDSIGGPSGSTLPGSANPVVIGDGMRHFHTVTIPAGYNNIVTGSLRVNSGSILDLTVTTGHNFGSIPESKISGNGRIRISSEVAAAEFPRGDFGLFLGRTGGTIEYYSTATSGANTITIPTIKADGISLTTYKNLILSPWTGKVINLPNTNLTIYNDLVINVTTNGTASLSTSSVSYTLTVKGNAVIDSGTFRFPNTNGYPQHMVVENDVIVHRGASFTVLSNGNSVNNTLTISGNLENNGSVDMHPDANPHCDLTFTGISNKEIKGTEALLTRLNAITVDKGTSRAPVLDVTVNDGAFNLNTALSNALTLTNGTFRLTTPTTINLSTAALTIPVTGCLSANGGTFNLCTANDDSSDLCLNGRLEVLDGTVNIGASANTNNNDLEYASAGIPELIVRGGTLNVYGQIRRGTLIETGSLNYTQSGGQVFIFGRNAQNARSMLEIENTGSFFRMSGGTLTLVSNFNNAAYDDLYLVPDTSDVTGGTIRLGTSSTTASQFNIVIASPVWNLNIDGNTTIKTVNLKVSPLTVLNDLTIGNSSGVNSILNTNGLNVTIGHNLYNYNSTGGTTLTVGGFQAYSATQLTTFNGNSNQLVLGVSGNVTNFANLAISNSNASVIDSLASGISNIRINGDLAINSGILADGNNIITVIGNIYNTATHRSQGNTGGILMQGSQKQFISGDGNGSFGNINISNTNGVDLLDNATITGRLTLASGLFYINDMLLTMGANSNIGGTPGSSNMIRTNGALSDLGVKKLFATGASSFTYPIGVTGKYTPVTFNITANAYTGTSSILVKPVNSKHPATYELTPATDELQYYWDVTSAGFDNGVTATHTYYYISSDAEPVDTGYVVGRYHHYTWSTPVEGSVDSVNNRFMLSGSANIDGEYTCGRVSNFVDLQTFYSRNVTAGTAAGAPWNSASSWTLTPDGSGDPAPYAPDGNPLVILQEHRINAVTNGNKAYSILLNGILDLGSTVNHSHGHVSGNGMLIIKSTDAGYFVFPGGEYDAFMNTEGTVVEFVSAIPATLPNAIGTVYKPFQNVRFRGTGTKYMACVNMKVLGDLDIRQGYLSNSLANKNIHVLGNWNDSTNSGFVAGKGLVSFEGTQKQVARINTSESFYDFQLNNALGDSLAGIGASNVMVISNDLYLISGNIVTNVGNMLHVTNNSTDAVIGGSSSSFVKGPMRKTVTSGSYFEFPIGKDNRYGNVYVSGTGAAGVLEAEYYTSNPYNVSSRLSPIDTVTGNESWRIDCSENTTGRVQIRWDSQSDIIPATAIGRTKLRVVGWNGTAWANKGGVGNGTLTDGTIQSDSAITLFSDRYYTIGLESLPTANITSGDVSICNNGVDNAAITVALTGSAPWTLKYRTGTGEEQTVSSIGFSPATLVLNSSSPGISGTGVYPLGITYVCDGTGSIGMKNFTKKINITVLESPAPSIMGKSPVSQNEASVRYSVTHTAGHSYTWVVTGGTITAGQGSSQITVEWGTGASGTVEVTETINATGCAVMVSRNIVINPAPSPVIVGNTQVCSGSIETYTTGEASTHQFVWTVTGGTIIGAASGLGVNSIQVSWNQGVASGSVKVSEAIPSPYGVGYDSIGVIINPLPDDELVVSDPVICYGNSTSIVVENAEGGMDYALRLNNDNSVVSSIHTSAPGDITFTVNPLTSTVYNILATNEYGCSNVLMDLAAVTVRSAPTVADAGIDQTDLCGTVSITLAANTPVTGTGLWTIVSGTGGTLGSASNPASSFTGISGNSYTLRWTISSSPCPASTDDMIVTFNSTALTTADAGDDQTALCGLTSATLEANTPIDGTGRWSVISGNGGSFSSDVLPGAVFTGMIDSTYVLQWTISKAPCRASTDEVTIAFPGIPQTSSIMGNATPACEATGITYSVTAHPGSSYAWSVPAHAVITLGQTGPGNNAIIVNLSNRSGYVAVVETSAAGCMGQVERMQVDVQGCTLIPDFEADVTNACVNQEIVFSDSSQGVNSTTIYQWNFGEGADTVTASGPGPHYVVYTIPGQKTVQLTISNGTPETLTRNNYITVHRIPAVTLPDISRCGPGTVDMQASLENGDSVDFSTDAGSTIIYSDNTAPYRYSFETSAPATMQVWARAYNTVTGCAGTWDSSAVIQVFAGPTTEAITSDYTGTLPAGYIDVVCNGSAIASTYSVKGGGDPTAVYNWSIPALDTIIPNQNQFSINWDVPSGDYIIELQKISPDGCSGTIRDTLVMITRPAVDLGDDVSLCQGADRTFDPGIFTSYLWQNNSTAETYTATATGKVYVRVTDAYGCTASDTVMVNLHPNPIVNLGNDTVLCGSSMLQLDAGEYSSYQWSSGENTNSITVHAGAGHVSVTVTNENGCQGTDEIVISDCTPVDLIHIPNTFTPNDDNSHDTWVIKYISSFPDAKILVYDRWGRVVFKCEGGYSKDWDGTNNGNDLPVDTYFYVIDLNVPGSETITGTVTIIR